MAEDLKMFKKLYDNLQEPKPPYDYYLKMLPKCNYNPNEVRRNYLNNIHIAGSRLDEEGERVNGGHSIGWYYNIIMFIECYRIPVHDWDKDDNDIKVPENKVLIPLQRIDYICSAPHNTKRAEILLSTDKRIHVVGSYEEVLKKIENLGETTHIINRLKD